MGGRKTLRVSIYFVWQWWERYYQKAHDRPSVIDIDWLDETYRGRQRFLYDHFGQFGIGQETPVLYDHFVSKVMPFHCGIIPVTLGVKSKLKEVGGYAWISLDIETIKKIQPVDIAKTWVGELIMQEREKKLQRYGVVEQMIDLGSVSNNAFILRGQEFYGDLIVDKDFACHYLEVITETMCLTHRFITNLFGSIDGFPLGNCNVVMMSPDLYVEMIRDYDIQCVEYAAQLTGKEPSCNLHHCNVKVDPFVEAYSTIPGLHTVQGSYLSDIKKFHQILPDVNFSAMVSPSDLLNKSLGQIEEELNWCLATGAHDLAIWDIDPDFSPQRSVELLRIIEKVATKNNRKPEFAVIPISWEELDWEFPIYQ